MTELHFDTSNDTDRVERGTMLPLSDSVLIETEKGVRPNFRLESNGSVTLISKTGTEIPNFGQNGRVVEG